jgi:hypothetical protein
MKPLDLLDIIGEVSDDYIDNAKKQTKRKSSKTAKWLSIAACFILIVSGTWTTLDRLDYQFMSAGCSGYPGMIVDGTYYYMQPHKGIISYTPDGESQLQLHTFWCEEWDVNDYGIYYWNNLSLYVKPHNSDKRIKLHSSNWFECSHIRFDLREDGNVIFIGYNKRAEKRFELLLDGKTGELIETVMEPTSYDDFEIAYSDSHKTIGSREIVLVESEESRTLYKLTENGTNLLPDGMFTGKYSSEYRGGALWYNVWSETRKDYEDTFALLYPDGRTELVTLPNERYCGDDTSFLFYPSNGQIWCTEVSTAETWELTRDADIDFHDLESDGKYIYSTAPWKEEQTCWKIIYNNSGKPESLELVNADLYEN